MMEFKNLQYKQQPKKQLIMDEKKVDAGRTVNIRVKPVYTLDRDKRMGADVSNVNMYLHKNNEIAMCPFRALLVKEGIISIPCGEDCVHFHFAPETRRQPKKGVESPDPKNPEHFEVVETGKIMARLTCGCGGANGMGTFYPISNVDASGQKPAEGKIIQLNSK